MSVGFALVTGGAGLIGSHLVDRLVSNGWRVRVPDNFSSGRMENVEHHSGNRNVEILRGDLKNFGEAERAVRDVNVIYHYAANPEVRVSTTNPEIHFNENVMTTFNLLDAMRRNDVSELVFASSSIIRYANVVGPRLRHGVIWDFVNKLKKNPSEVEILGDGKQVRSYIYIYDAIESTIIAWRRSANGYGIYNIASKDWTSVDEVADEVMTIMGLTGVRRVYEPILHGVGWPGDVKRVALKIERLKALGFKPMINSRKAIRTAVKKLIEGLNGS